MRYDLHRNSSCLSFPLIAKCAYITMSSSLLSYETQRGKSSSKWLTIHHSSQAQIVDSPLGYFWVPFFWEVIFFVSVLLSLFPNVNLRPFFSLIQIFFFLPFSLLLYLHTVRSLSSSFPLFSAICSRLCRLSSHHISHFSFHELSQHFSYAPFFV